MGAKITRKTNLTASLLTNIQKTANTSPNVKAGFLEDKEYPDGTNVATVAYWNEFGTKSSPARPFMRNTIAKNQGEWGKDFGEVLKALNGDIAGALRVMGQEIEGQIREEITSGDFAENSITTNILKDRFPKGGYTFDDFLQAHADAMAGQTAPSGKPLVWSGLMLQSVTSEVDGA